MTSWWAVVQVHVYTQNCKRQHIHARLAATLTVSCSSYLPVLSIHSIDFIHVTSRDIAVNSVFGTPPSAFPRKKARMVAQFDNLRYSFIYHVKQQRKTLSGSSYKAPTYAAQSRQATQPPLAATYYWPILKGHETCHTLTNAATPPVCMESRKSQQNDNQAYSGVSRTRTTIILTFKSMDLNR